MHHGVSHLESDIEGFTMCTIMHHKSPGQDWQDLLSMSRYSSLSESDGEESLVQVSAGKLVDHMDYIGELTECEPELASHSLSYLPAMTTLMCLTWVLACMAYWRMNRKLYCQTNTLPLLLWFFPLTVPPCS